MLSIFQALHRVVIHIQYAPAAYKMSVGCCLRQQKTYCSSEFRSLEPVDEVSMPKPQLQQSGFACDVLGVHKMTSVFGPNKFNVK